MSNTSALMVDCGDTGDIGKCGRKCGRMCGRRGQLRLVGLTLRARLGGLTSPLWL